ncbi:ATP-dependent RNA helicase DHX30-like isoform X2 [Artemia franciscana]|uniref:ATP-dependent RNA helicase DHX30-like isoform X2 n=1 Tax=Artemia franciscana TaxID=6661 RepID=UPI0032DB6DC4
MWKMISSRKQDISFVLPRRPSSSGAYTAKVALNNVIVSASSKLGTRLQPPKYIHHKQDGAKKVVAEVQLSWPESLRFCGVDAQRKEAELKAAEEAVNYLKKMGIVGEDSKLIPSAIGKPEPSIKTHGGNEVLKKYGNPISAIDGIYNQVRAGLKDPYVAPVFEFTKDEGLPHFKCTLKLKWPEEVEFSETAPSKMESKTYVCKMAVDWLILKKAVHQKGFPFLCSKEELEAFNAEYNAGVPVLFPEPFVKEARNFLEAVKELEKFPQPVTAKMENQHVVLEPNEILDEELLPQRPREVNDLEDTTEAFNCINPFTGKPSSKPYTATTLTNREVALKMSLTNKWDTSFRPLILDVLHRNQVVIVSGHTGCGKSTQVPQMIFDAYIEAHHATECNIIVTEPRRLAAISLGEWVARERAESVGHSVGYIVRLDSAIPQEPGGIVYCTGGVLLRRLQFDPSLTGISHVIIDEVHERDITSDFLLILLKDVLKRNSNLRVILMSASADIQKLMKYFDAPHLNMGGVSHPVKEMFLEDLCHESTEKGIDLKLSHRGVGVDVDLVARVIQYVDAKEGPGAILCFLPGWGDIAQVRRKLSQIFVDEMKYWIQPLHSRLSVGEQHRIFDAAPADVRKIVLSTNIAETSLTVPDVVYVIDPGFMKQLAFHAEMNTSVMETQWIAKSNALQRKGRAGRVQQGVVYRLYSRSQYEALPDYQTPEMLRTSLDRMILDLKAYDETLKAEIFLATALEPPRKEAIQAALKELISIKALNEDESLTPLGRRLLPIPLPPRLAKAVVYSVIMGCLNPVLNGATILSSGKELFLETLENRQEIRQKRRLFSTESDIIAAIRIVTEWLQSTSNLSKGELLQEMALDVASLEFIFGVSNLMKEHLVEANLVYSSEEVDGLHLNVNSNSEEIVLAAFLCGFEKNLVRVKHGIPEKGQIKRDMKIYTSLNGRVFPTSDFVSEKPSSDLLFYLGALDQPHGKTIFDVNEISPMTALLFGGNSFKFKKDKGFTNMMINGSEDVSLRLKNEDLDLALQLRAAIQFSFDYLLHSMEGEIDPSLMGKVAQIRSCLVQLLQKAFQSKG